MVCEQSFAKRTDSSANYAGGCAGCVCIFQNAVCRTEEDFIYFTGVKCVPGNSLHVCNYRIIKTLNLLNSYMGLVFIYAGSMAIFVFWNMKGYFDSIPEAIEDAARIDGVNDRQLITKIVMPLARPSIIISSVLVVIYVWNEYIFSTVFLSGAEKNTLAVALYSLQATDYTRNWPLFSAAAILTTLPVLILFFLVQKYMVSGLSSGGVKG